MALDTARLAVELDSMIAELPVSVTCGSITFDAAISMSTVGSDIEEGGFMPNRDAGLNVRETVDTKKVKVGSKITVTSNSVTTTYRVISVERSQDGQELIFSCQSHRR